MSSIRIALNAGLLVAAATLAGCASLDLTGYRTVLASRAAELSGWHGLPVESGQIIVNEHPGAISMFLSLSAARYAPFIHAGLVFVEDGRPFVYEEFGSFVPLPWRTPNANMAGGVRRVSLESFLQRGGIVAIYDPPVSVDRNLLRDFAREHLRARTPFDGRFDADDASKFYCVEFVARALEASGAAPVARAPSSHNPSMRIALDWLGIDNPEILLAGDLLADARRAVLFSRRASPAEIVAYFALKAELHRRFTDDQRLGNLFRWRHQRAYLRPKVAAYLDDGVKSGVDARALALQMFGPIPGDRDDRVAGVR